MTGMGGIPYSQEMRDIIQRMVVEVVERERPRYRYATVIKIDRTARKCSVVFNGETGAVQVNMGSIQPNAVNQIVRVEGIGIDKYITDVIGESYSGIRRGRIQPLYTSGKPYVTWDDETALSGPYEVFSAYSPSQYDVVQGINIPGKGIVLYPVQDFLTNMPYAKWHSLSLQNGWVEYDGTFGQAKFTKTSSGIVKLQGLIKNGTVTAGTLIATLPVGFRPGQRVMATSELAGSGVNGSGNVEILQDGRINIRVGNAGYMSLDQISFPCVEVAPDSAWLAPTLASGWGNYGTLTADTGWGNAGVWKDADGIVWERGLVRKADLSNTSGNIFVKPVGYRVPSGQAMHRRATAADRNAIIQNFDDGNSSYASGDGTSFVSLDGIPFVPSGTTAPWQSVGFQNGWVNYGAAWATAQFFKTKSGHVHIKGLIQAGTGNNQLPMFTLPAGYRPARRLLLGSAANGLRCRIDITPAGEVLAMDQTSGVWTSVDSLNFVAEQ